MLNLLNVKKYYKSLPHQKIAVQYLGGNLLNTPAKERLGLKTPEDLLTLSDADLVWLQRQLEATRTFAQFTKLWRADSISTRASHSDFTEKLFSQRDNSILPYVTCASSASAMYTDYQLRVKGKKGLATDEGYLGRVFSGKYGNYEGNNSIYWDIQTNVIKSYGVNSAFIWNSDLDGLKKEVEKNGCSVINIYHTGYNYATRGGGHVVLATDFKPNGDVVIHDPYGERPPEYKFKNVGARIGSSVSKKDELDILHRLVLCEARGEGILGMALVARCVLNRLRLTQKRLENFNTRDASISGIIYAPHQFEPTWSTNNSIDTIYSRTSQEMRDNALKAISLSQDVFRFENELSKKGYNKEVIRAVLRNTFFAAITHPHAISPYVDKYYAVGNQVVGEGKNTKNVSEDILFEKYQFQKAMKSDKLDLVGVYLMSAQEFSYRWEGCWRYLIED